MALIQQYPPHHIEPQWVYLTDHPLRECRIRITVDCANAFIKSISGLTKIRRIREAEDVAEQVGGIRTALEDLSIMSSDGVLDGLYVDNEMFENLMHDIQSTHQLLEDCDRLLARMKKNGIKWDIKHDVLIASILQVWRDFAFEMGDRLHQALVSKLKRRRDRLQRYISELRKNKRTQQQVMEQKVQNMQQQYFEEMEEMQARLEHLEHETRKQAHQVQTTQKLLMSPNGPPMIVDAQPSPTMEAQQSVAIYEPIPMLDAYGHGPIHHDAYLPPRAPTAPPMAPPPPPPPQPLPPRRMEGSCVFGREIPSFIVEPAEVMTYEREFDNNLILRVFRQPSTNRVRLVLFELDPLTGQYIKYATYASGLTIERAQDSITLSSLRTGQRWVRLVFKTGYADLAVFFLYVQVLRLLDQQHDGTPVATQLESIAGENKLFESTIYEHTARRSVALYHDAGKGGSNMLRIQVNAEEGTPMWTAFLNEGLPTPRSYCCYDPPRSGMLGETHNVYIEVSRKVSLGVSAKPGMLENITGDELAAGPQPGKYLELEFKRAEDAIHLADIVKTSLDMGFGNEKMMTKSFYDFDILPWTPAGRGPVGSVRHVYGV